MLGRRRGRHLLLEVDRGCFHHPRLSVPHTVHRVHVRLVLEALHAAEGGKERQTRKSPKRKRGEGAGQDRKQFKGLAFRCDMFVAKEGNGWRPMGCNDEDDFDAV